MKPVIPPLPFVESYRDPSTHQMMLEDVVRTTSYDEALKEVVTPASKVLDFGTGTGVLAIFAARHGAKSVDAVDRSTFLRHARRIAKDTGFPDIRFHHADHDTLVIGEKVDVLVSEWMGHCLFYEAMMEPLLAVRDKYLAEDGVMVPARVALHAALLTDETFHEQRSFFLGNPYGINFSSIAEQPLRQSQRVRIELSQVDRTRFDFGPIDMKTVTGQPEELVARGRIYQASLCYGIVAWFSCDLTDKVRFGTGPEDAPTHWDQLYFPFPQAVLVVPDQETILRLEPPHQPENEDPTWVWSIEHGDEFVEVDEAETFAESLDPHAEV